MDISLLVVHYISLPPGKFGGDCVEDFFLNRLDTSVDPSFASIANVHVSAHFFVRRDGEIVQFVGCDYRAWHAGQSSWQGRVNCNDYSVGVELEGCDTQPFEAAQYASLQTLVEALQERYPITAAAGHCDIAPGRKIDPGRYFDWGILGARCPKLVLPHRTIPGRI